MHIVERKIGYQLLLKTVEWTPFLETSISLLTVLLNYIIPSSFAHLLLVLAATHYIVLDVCILGSTH